jgi:leucyl/phenylalanyl-tRNA--protein transferase
MQKNILMPNVANRPAAIRWLDPQSLDFPDPQTALQQPNGLLAIGGDLSVERLLYAYRQGIFPWYEDPQPILWWSPTPRAVLLPERLHISRSLRKVINSGKFTASIDCQFERVLECCASLRQYREGTWITPAMSHAYNALFALGYAHSIEILHQGELVGGLYGVALGQVFYGESMFSLHSNASKVALFVLCETMQRRGGRLIDCQVMSDHLRSMGASGWSRGDFMFALEKYARAPDTPGRWELPEDLVPLTTRPCTN